MSFQISDLHAYASRFYGGAQILLTPFAYTATFGTIPAAINTDELTPFQTRVVNIASNADFIATELSYNALGTDGAVSAIQALMAVLQIEDTGSNEKFFNNPVQLDNICNNAYGLQSFAFPRFISGKTALQFSIAGNGGFYNQQIAITGGLDVVLSGVLVRVFAQ